MPLGTAVPVQLVTSLGGSARSHSPKIFSRKISACPQCCASSRSMCRYTQRRGSGPRRFPSKRSSQPQIRSSQPRGLARFAMCLLNACDGVGVVKDERLVRCGRDANFAAGPA